MTPRYADALRSLRSIWIDAGTRDVSNLKLNLIVGAAAFRAALLAAGAADERIRF